MCWDHKSKPSYDHTLELQLWTIFPLPLLWLDHGKVQPRVKAPTYPKNSWDKIVLICSFYSLVIIFQHICLSQVTVEISAPELTWWCDNWKGRCDLWFHSRKENPQVELYAVPYVLPPPRWMFLRCALQQLCKSQEELDKGIRILPDLLHDLQAQSSFPAHHINWPATFGPKKRPQISHICIRPFWRKNYQLPEKPNTLGWSKTRGGVILQFEHMLSGRRSNY